MINGELPWFPGQAGVETFSSTCTKLYATLIFGWLSAASDLPNDIDIHHHFSRWADQRDWPSPVKAFLRSARWFPIEDPGQSGFQTVGVRPSEVWMNDFSGERFVPFLRRPPHSLRRYLERASERVVRNLRTYAALRIFNDPASLPEQLNFLERTTLAKASISSSNAISSTSTIERGCCFQISRATETRTLIRILPQKRFSSEKVQ